MKPDILSFSLKKSWQAKPLQVSQWGPYGERYPLPGHFYVSLNIYLFIFPSDSFIHSFIYVCLLESPQRSPPAYGEKHKLTFHRAPRRQKAYIKWGAAWFPKRIINNTAISTPAPCSLWHDTFHLGLGRPDRTPLASGVVATPIRVYPPQLLLPPTWPRVEQSTNLRYPEVRMRGWIYGRHVYSLVATLFF